jgi:hypothetical protein
MQFALCICMSKNCVSSFQFVSRTIHVSSVLLKNIACSQLLLAQSSCSLITFDLRSVTFNNWCAYSNTEIDPTLTGAQSLRVSRVKCRKKFPCDHQPYHSLARDFSCTPGPVSGNTANPPYIKNFHEDIIYSDILINFPIFL